MSSSAVANPPVQESKTARKKRAKAEAAAAASAETPASVATSVSRVDTPNLDGKSNGDHDGLASSNGLEEHPVINETNK